MPSKRRSQPPASVLAAKKDAPSSTAPNAVARPKRKGEMIRVAMGAALIFFLIYTFIMQKFGTRTLEIL
jgi:hypothetical protein